MKKIPTVDMRLSLLESYVAQLIALVVALSKAEMHGLKSKDDIDYIDEGVELAMDNMIILVKQSEINLKNL